jgi:hypothetical protein
MLPGTDPGPGGELRWGGERGHVRAGLGEDVLRSGRADPGDRGEQFPRPGQVMIRDECVDEGIELCDMSVEQIDAVQVQSHQRPVVFGEVALERAAQLLCLDAQSPASQVGSSSP